MLRTAYEVILTNQSRILVVSHVEINQGFSDRELSILPLDRALKEFVSLQLFLVLLTHRVTTRLSAVSIQDFYLGVKS